ncbi:SusC/RagA family TonB-linked outer membrane protein [Longitalea luteola]|uniref:SusC/RagA family TonB-linked outer membrane protein n=1 Tax=Longitalea luteola TaxID=2812563 RepID=UPI001A95FA77|nr:TonB-dependent receptor [Longitalea luteola]
MKLVLLSLGISLLAYSPVYSIPRDRTFDHNNGLYQAVPITGTVTDDKDQPLPGVTVTAKGTQRITQTNAAGVFSIEMPAGVKVLVFSYAGMETQEVNIDTSTSIRVQLRPAEAALEDVVVIGYGTQKRANVTGAVATVSGNTLTERPAPNSVNLLQGRLPGLTVNQNTAEPGRDGNSLLIRGRSSFTGSNTPLVLIDGVPGSLNNLSPDDIENATVLKDAASASIYGARAANGVILITTKKGKKGETLFNYRVNVARHSATRLPDLITNSAEYMELYNAAIDAGRTNGVPVKYPQAEIEKYRTPSDEYPSFNYIDHYVRPALVHNHNLSVSGGSEKSTFNISMSYLDQNALLPGYNFKRYNSLINYSTQLTKAITVGTIINATYKNRQDPPFTGENMMLAIYAAGPLYGPFLPDGSGRIVSRAYTVEGRNRNPQEMYEMGWQNTKEYNLNGQAFVDIKILKNLVWSSKAAINYVDEYYKMYQHNYDSYVLQERAANGDYARFSFGPDIPGVTDQYSKLLQPTIYSTLTYNTQIGDHSIKALAGYEQVSQSNQGLRGRRINTVSQALTDLTGYNATNESLYFSHPRLPGNVNPQEWGLRSWFGRVNYDYQGKYFLEGNLRYDGTSKVHPDYRWGLFPSVSAGWMISRENFLQDKFYWLTDLKLRGSYGVLGNQDIGTYLYQNVLTINNVLYPFGNQPAVQGAVNNTFRDISLQWESTRVFDLGFDLVIQKGLVGVTFDWFNKYTYDILATPLIPASIGMNAPTINNGRMRNRGIELALTHQNRIGQVSYGLNGILSTARNEVLEVRIPSFGTTTVQVGAPYNSYYLYLWDGIVQEGETPLPHSLTNTGLKPGDIKMRDVNGPDGKPDGRITPEDRVIVKGAYPDYTYSFGGNVDYKGFGLTFFFQGVQGVKSRVINWGVDPFMQGTPPTTEWRNAWTPENKSQSMPAIYIKDYPHMNNYNGSTYFLRDASYLRLKNVTLSYTFPRPLMSRLKVKDVMLYVSADNLVTWTDFKNGDPERANFSTAENSPTTNFSQYPQTRILNLGLNVKF